MIDINRIRSNIDDFYRKKRIEKQVQHNSKYCAKYYDSAQWKKLRENYRLQHPLCECCLSNGLAIPATEIHHKKRFMSGLNEEAKWRLLLNPNNLVSLCKECHTTAHRYMNKYNTDIAGIEEINYYKDNMEENLFK